MSDKDVAAPALSQLLTHRSAKWREFPKDILPLPVAEMDFPVAAPIKEILLEMVNKSDLGYLGLIPELGKSFAYFAKNRWNWVVDPLQVRLATDVGVAVVELLRVFTKPGEKILIMSPVYQNFYTWIDETRLEKVDVPFINATDESDDEHPWLINWDAIEKAYASGIKVHLLCSPHNPLGRIFEPEELLRLANLAKKYEVLIISDEIHAPLTYKDRIFTPFLTLGPIAQEVGICVTAASKGWNIAGLKAAIIVSQSEVMNEKLKSLPPAMHYRASLLGGFATVAAFQSGEVWLDTVINLLDKNRFMIRDLLSSQLPSVKYHIPHNSYLAWLDLSALNLGENPAATLIESGKVAFNPGQNYGVQCSQFVRFNFATSPEIITEAIHRITKAL